MRGHESEVGLPESVTSDFHSYWNVTEILCVLCKCS